MSPGVHARLSASGAERWINCPPSITLEERFPDKDTQYTREGSFAHSLAELLLDVRQGKLKREEADRLLLEFKANEFFTEALHDHVADYVEFVLERAEGGTLFIETRLDFSRWVPGGFGTGDAIVIKDGVIEVIDLKFGQGKPVFADGNNQMQLYALGAVEAYDTVFDFHTVRMTIFQPRINNTNSAEMSVTELLMWADETVAPAAKLAEAGEGQFTPGIWCGFCKAKGICQARAANNLELAKKEFAEELTDPQMLTEEQVLMVLQRGKQLADWIKDVQDYALSTAVNDGRQWPGYKVVAGVARRSYSSEDAVVNALKDLGVAEPMLYRRQVLPLSEMEKVVGKKLFSQLPEGLIVKPQGKPALVSEGDKRPALNAAAMAAIEFMEEIENV